MWHVPNTHFPGRNLAESNFHSQGVSAPPGYSDELSVRKPRTSQLSDSDTEFLVRGIDCALSANSRNQSSQLQSVWSEEASELPEFSLPNVYYIGRPILRLNQFQKFSIPTLFYIFYSFPSEMYQSLAAAELYKKHWRYDLATSKWFTNAMSVWKCFDLDLWSEQEASVPTTLLRLEEFNARPRT